MEAYYLYLKAIHLIFSVLWFLGLISSGYIFVQHLEASEKSGTEKLILFEKLKSIAVVSWKKIA